MRVNLGFTLFVLGTGKMANRVTIEFPQPEYSALLREAVRELRNPPDQVRYIVREYLADSGLLPRQADLSEEQCAKEAA
jgi:hypothetical protein